MKNVSSKTLKNAGTKKAKTGPTKASKSPTRSKRTTSQMWWWDLDVLNSKVISLYKTERNFHVSGEIIQRLILGFSLTEITESGEILVRSIRIGPKGLEYRGPLAKKYRGIGWNEIDYLWESKDTKAVE